MGDRMHDGRALWWRCPLPWREWDRLVVPYPESPRTLASINARTISKESQFHRVEHSRDQATRNAGEQVRRQNVKESYCFDGLNARSDSQRKNLSTWSTGWFLFRWCERSWNWRTCCKIQIWESRESKFKVSRSRVKTKKTYQSRIGIKSKMRWKV